MKITNHTKWGYNYSKFSGKYIEGHVYDDGSGELEIKSPNGYVRCGDYFEDSGLHKDRVEDIKRLAKLYANAYNELCKLQTKLKN